MDVVREAEYQTTVETTGYRRKPVYDFIKRIMDICCSSVALVILSPILLITMIAIYIDDPGRCYSSRLRAEKPQNYLPNFCKRVA